ncbi:DNA-directed RNA polymerase sigma subunit (sigma70/sigma32) [Neobacillus sp. B4I6]|uniref:sigma factor-like helix-turn-helix DNA-binding protein n=1 Tax=Neobacillus sp. B4I6 TaxID=3373925 RepID=UPI003D1D5BCF
MEYKTKLTKDDAIFFMDMVGSVRSPNFVPRLHKRKPYYKILNERNSEDYQRFIRLYETMKHILTQREQTILNEMYGLNQERARLTTVGELLNISRDRVRQLRNGAENKIVKELLVKTNITPPGRRERT